MSGSFGLLLWSTDRTFRMTKFCNPFRGGHAYPDITPLGGTQNRSRRVENMKRDAFYDVSRLRSATFIIT